MSSEQSQPAIEIFDTASGLPPEERDGYLASACDGDDDLRRQVERLLLRHEEAEAEGFLAQPALPDPNRETAGLLGRQIGTYKLLRELGSGGMGIVYLAIRADDVYQKEVAVKLVWPAMQRTSVIRRFKQERQILARLDHPNIARLLDGGATEEGWPYIVMEYVDGAPITEYCDARRLNITERLKLFRTVCAAVSYAHQNLIVHRDLKPGNIFVTTEGAVKLLDFGIAKLLDPEPQSSEPTLTGLPLLTPEYASPEQANGEAITTASDIYSLGVALYELLTGHRPYRIENPSPREIARVIAEAKPEPPSTAISRVVTETNPEGETRTVRSPEMVSATREGAPEKLRSRLRGDLDNIVLMALRKEPGERYQSAAQLSEDIERYLTGRPILAQTPTIAYRVGKYVRRHKALTAAVALVFIALIAGVIALFQWARSAAEEAERNRNQAYAAEMNQAAQEWASDPASANLPRMQELLDHWLPDRPGNAGKEDLRDFEWRYLWRLLHRDQQTLRLDDMPWASRFISESLIATSSSNHRQISLMDAVTGRIVESHKIEGGELIDLHGYEGGFRFFVIEASHTLKIWQMPNLRLIATLHDKAAITVAAPLIDRRIVMTGHDDGSLKFWDIESARPLFTLKNSTSPIKLIEITPDRQYLLAQAGDHTAELWNLARKRVVYGIHEQERIVSLGSRYDRISFLFEGGRTLKFYDLRSGRLTAAFHFASPITRFGLTNDHRFITFGTDGKLRLLSFPSGRPLATLEGHTDYVNHYAYFRNEKLLATVSSDRTLRFWDLHTLQPIAVIRGHAGEVQGVHISRNEQKLLTTSDDRTIKIWDIAELLKPETLKGHRGFVYAVAISRDGKTIATAGQDGDARVWDADRGLRVILRGHTDEVLAVAISPDGNTVATGSKDNTAKLWDASTGKLLKTITGHSGWVRAVAFSPSGEQLATGNRDQTVKLWDVATGSELATLKGHTDEILSVSYSRDGSKLLTGSADKTAKIWDLRERREIITLKGHRNWVWSAKFSPDETRVATGSMDWDIKLWDAATGRELKTFKGHANEVFSLDFHPDGKRLASASNDKTIKIWNIGNGQELLTLKDHKDQVWSVAFSKDGNTMVSGSWDGTARIWRGASEEEVRARIGK